jgi:hypothetical protein
VPLVKLVVTEVPVAEVCDWVSVVTLEVVNVCVALVALTLVPEAVTEVPVSEV